MSKSVEITFHRDSMNPDGTFGQPICVTVKSEEVPDDFGERDLLGYACQFLPAEWRWDDVNQYVFYLPSARKDTSVYLLANIINNNEF